MWRETHHREPQSLMRHLGKLNVQTGNSTTEHTDLSLVNYSLNYTKHSLQETLALSE
jgi:hypothetical protein